MRRPSCVEEGQKIGSIVADRLNRRVRLSGAEISFLESLEAESIDYERRATIRRAGERMHEAFVLKSGWVISFTEFADGSRQIRRLHLPGDLVTVPSMALKHHAEDVEAVTPVTISPFERNDFVRLFEHLPRLAAIMFMFAQVERITYGDRLSCMGRLDCKARLAFMVLDIFERLRSVDASVGNGFQVHLTREHMAEMTGMTPIHASRKWSELIDDGLIGSEGHSVTVLDEARLAALSGYINRSRDLDFSWLPGGPGPIG
jgi:CRP/FNR family transcriptional regulator